jgi:cytochrome c-type biogenesis protein CcmH/NrfG
MPNDVSLHEFLALDLFAQGKYEQAAAPLYAVLSVGPGWNWTTLSGNYSDISVYSQQLRGLEAFVRANPKSAKAQFVLAYQYISQGQGEAAIRPLQNVVALQPNDKLSAQLIEMLQPPKTAAAAP